MSTFIAWTITALVVVLLLTFVGSLISTLTMPAGERPRTRTYDRFGRVMGFAENPDYHDNPGEDSAAMPSTIPRNHEVGE
jgi:hypothetical protein